MNVSRGTFSFEESINHRITTAFRTKVHNAVKTLIVVLVFVIQRKFKFVQAYAVNHQSYIIKCTYNDLSGYNI